MKEFICSACPEGCRVRIDSHGAVSGNGCPNGEALSRQSSASSGCIFSGKINVLGGAKAQCAVSSSGEIPRRLLYPAMEALRSVTLFAPIKRGQVISPNFLQSGVGLIAEEDIEEI